MGKDLNLALLAAKETKDYEWAHELSVMLAKGGVPLRYFEKFKTYKWYEMFKLNFQNYIDYYNENFHPELRTKILALLERDNEFNHKYHKWRTKEIEMSIADLIQGASKILNDFKSINEEYGFPKEEIMGYNYVLRKNSVDSYPIDVLMVHIYQRGVLLFLDEIGDIVCTGALPPNYIEILKGIRGFGNSEGIEQEMNARYLKYRGKE